MQLRPMLGALLMASAMPFTAGAQDAKPNILVIFGDDIGIANVSAYSDGVMGYDTPNIDRIGEEGIRFLHYYGEQSCTAGRAAFLTGQHGIRTGLTKVGFPGAPMGMSQLDPSIGGLHARASATPPASSARTTSATATSRCPPSTASTSSSATSTTSTPRKSPSCPTIRRIPAYLAKFGPRGVLKTARPPTSTTRPSTRASARSASRRSRTPAR